MSEYILLFPLIVSFLVSLFLLPPWIRRAQHAGLVGRDMNKVAENKVAEAGGVTVIAGFVIGTLFYIALKTFYLRQGDYIPEIFALMSVVLIVAFIGMIDDLLGWKIGLSKRVRLFLVLFAAVPLIVINAGSSAIYLPFLEKINLGLWYLILVIPLGVVGASTTFNFLAGYNGLEARQGILLLAALAIAVWFTGSPWLAIISLCMAAALAAFLIFNTYPAQVFPGDVMTYSLGALIAAIAILGNIEKFAVFIFIPNIIEIILKLRGGLKKESFAVPQKDGSIVLRYSKIYGLEHAAIKILQKYKKKVYEQDVVHWINIFQVAVILIGFIIFREGIFAHG
ncbi:MAG TPA: glycosyl transferase family 4 [Candidatus Nanoarchaeia archaeon]|nr:glycosyl transferase family 4 [Candidatus Nanoarchaeia archaeon]